MMSPETLPAKPATKDDGGSRKPTPARPPEQSLRCPRCDSPNTKFCYYNNYSLTQPRHFCKTCRRYWTKGGALRNVPIGGGCRKNKKGKSSSSSSSRLSADSGGGIESSDIGGLKFFNGLSPAMDFQFGGLAASFPRYSPFGDISLPQSSAATSLPLLGMENLGISNPLVGFNFPIPSLMKQTGEIQDMGVGGGGGGGSMNVNSSLANSIESLSCMNQDLHWKLQQQRLAMIFGGGDDEVENQKQQEQQQMEKPQPIMFQNLEISKAPDMACPVKDGGNIATEWFFDSSYAPMNPTPTNSSGNNGNESTSNWSGMQTWSDMNQYI